MKELTVKDKILMIDQRIRAMLETDIEAARSNGDVITKLVVSYPLFHALSDRASKPVAVFGIPIEIGSKELPHAFVIHTTTGKVIPSQFRTKVIEAINRVKIEPLSDMADSILYSMGVDTATRGTSNTAVVCVTNNGIVESFISSQQIAIAIIDLAKQAAKSYESKFSGEMLELSRKRLEEIRKLKRDHKLPDSIIDL